MFRFTNCFNPTTSTELRTLRGTDVGLKEIDKLGSALSNVNNPKVAVQTLTNAFASGGGKQSENFAGFAKTETVAKVGQTIDC